MKDSSDPASIMGGSAALNPWMNIYGNSGLVGVRRLGRISTDCLYGHQISDIISFALDHLENHGLPLDFLLS